MQENPNDDANMVSDDSDDSFVQLASKKVAKRGDGFDGFGAPDPFNQNDDDQVDQGEPNDSIVQLASKKVAKRGDGFDGIGAPDPFNQR